jgi:perosamine synthetase
MTRQDVPVARPLIDEEEVQAAREVLLSGQYVSGERVEAFEGAFSRYVGVQHAVAVNSGTAALHIALQAMGIGVGDEVIVPPMSFFASISAVLYVGAIPVFADIDADDFCLSPVDARNKISERTKAILPVHLYGSVAKMDELATLAAENGISLLEDCAQALGSEFDGAKVGSLGDAGAFSFFATKHITTAEGGMIATDNANLAGSARMIRNHGLRGRDDHVLLGYNNRMTEIEAAIGLVQLGKLDGFNERRIAHSERIIRELEALSWAVVPKLSPRIKHTYFWCPVMMSSKSDRNIEDLKSHLDSNGIGYRHRYSQPLYKQPVLHNLGLDYSDVLLPVAEKTAGRIIGVPNHPGLKPFEIDRVIEVLRAF